jgi:hypothetical protein
MEIRGSFYHGVNAKNINAEKSKLAFGTKLQYGLQVSNEIKTICNNDPIALNDFFKFVGGLGKKNPDTTVELALKKNADKTIKYIVARCSASNAKGIEEKVIVNSKNQKSISKLTLTDLENSINQLIQTMQGVARIG